MNNNIEKKDINTPTLKKSTLEKTDVNSENEIVLVKDETLQIPQELLKSASDNIDFDIEFDIDIEKRFKELLKEKAEESLSWLKWLTIKALKGFALGSMLIMLIQLYQQLHCIFVSNNVQSGDWMEKGRNTTYCLVFTRSHRKHYMPNLDRPVLADLWRATGDFLRGTESLLNVGVKLGVYFNHLIFHNWPTVIKYPFIELKGHVNDLSIIFRGILVKGILFKEVNGKSKPNRR